MNKKNKLKISKIKINKYFSFKIRLKMLSSKMKIWNTKIKTMNHRYKI